MLKALFIFIFSLNLAFAGRFEEAEKKKFIDEVKQEILEHRAENGGMVDLQIIKPLFYLGLDDLLKKDKISQDEKLIMQTAYEKLASDKTITKVNAEAAFMNFLVANLDAIDRRVKPVAKEGQICTDNCEKGFLCEPVAEQFNGNQCRNTGNACENNSQCCSSECVINEKTKKGICEDVRRCTKLLGIGDSCKPSIACGVGTCLRVDKDFSGVAAFAKNFNTCETNDDCASELCDKNKTCQPNFKCTFCAGNNEIETSEKRCCPGFYRGDGDRCKPIRGNFWLPPAVEVSPIKSFFISLSSLVISNAEAQTNADLINFSASKKEECEESIGSVLKGRTGTCTLGGGCGVSCGKPSATCKSANPTFYGLCAKESELGYSDAKKDETGSSGDGKGSSGDGKGSSGDGKDSKEDEKDDKTDEEIAAEEDAFLSKQNEQANADILSTIKGSGDKYGAGFQAKSDTMTATEKKAGKLTISRKSNFETCEVKFKDDFMKYLNDEKNNLLELEMALLGFDFVMSGDGVNDYWSPNGNSDSSIYARLKAASKISKEQRAKLWESIDKANDQLTCMCLDAQGLKNIKLAEKKEFFMKSCAEYEKYSDPNVKEDELDGDASGIKGKKLLVAWTGKLREFNAGLVVDKSGLKEKIMTVHDYIKDDQVWNDTKTVTYPLFNFNIKNPSGSSAALGAILGAILAAGVIAIMGGFGTASILTAWGAAGIIAASAVTGAGGLWMISSLRGAWITKKPEILDRHVRTYGCGKKETCAEYTRELIQPFNDVCKKHISSNACVKDFLVIRENVKKNSNTELTEESVFLVDPWVPYKVPTNLLIKDSINGNDYASMLELGFQKAKGAMVAKNPQASGGGGKKGGGEFVAESYLSEIFLDPTLVGQYVPQLGNLEEKYFLRESTIKQIKQAAIEFAIDQKFFEKEDKENLKIFSEYAYEFHFLYPKRARLNEISYPSLGLTNYIDLMVNNVISGIAAGAAVAVGNADTGFTNTNIRYLDDYKKTVQLYTDAINQADPVKKAALQKEINAIDSELDRLRAISALLQNPANDSAGAFSRAISDFNNGANSGKGATLAAKDQAYLGAIGKLRSDRKDLVKQHAAYKKAVAASGKKAQADKVAKATTKFNNKFTKPISSASGLGSSLADTVSSAEANSAGNATSGAGEFGNSGSGSGADGYSNVAPFGAGSGGASGFGSSGSYGSSRPGAGVMGRNAGGMSDEDRKRLADAIDARNRANSGQYQSSDGQTLFEKVTNAYIRNYDKVLSKKKDKDVLEAK